MATMAKKSEAQHPIPLEIEALLSIVKSAAIRKAATRVPPHLWKASAEELEARLNLSDAAKAVRAAFWSEVAGALIVGQGVKVSRLGELTGLSYDHSHDLLTRDPAFLAWVLSPMHPAPSPAPLLSALLDRIADVVRLPLTDKRGRVIVRNAKLSLQAVQVLWPLCKR